MSYPISDPEEFKEKIKLWKNNTDYGGEILQEADLKIKFMYIKVMGKVKWDDIYMTKKPEYDKWQQWV